VGVRLDHLLPDGPLERAAQPDRPLLELLPHGPVQRLARLDRQLNFLRRADWNRAAVDGDSRAELHAAAYAGLPLWSQRLWLGARAHLRHIALCDARPAREEFRR
jgi:hypothetical protein